MRCSQHPVIPRVAARALILALLATLATLSACASGGGGAATGGTPSQGQGTTPATTDAPWAVKTREHVDLWLHGFGLLLQDTATVPYFRRGYRDEMTVMKNRMNVSTLLDVNREQLQRRFGINRNLVGAQFIALYFGSWEDIQEVTNLFLQAEGNPQRAGSQAGANAIALLAGYFPSAADRDWLRLFVLGLTDERDRYYHSYWVQEQQSRSATIAAVDSLWQRVYRPKLQGYLNNTQQETGDFLLSLPLDGEGRTIHEGSRSNIVALTFPEAPSDAVQSIYVFAHEAVFAVAQTAVNDNTTPTEKRNGVADRYQSSAAVRGGMMLLRRVAPELLDGYARYYLRAAGQTPAGDPGAQLDRLFPLPEMIRASIDRQIGVVIGGI
jgi:hypothetical protein